MASQERLWEEHCLQSKVCGWHKGAGLITQAQTVLAEAQDLHQGFFILQTIL